MSVPHQKPLNNLNSVSPVRNVPIFGEQHQGENKAALGPRSINLSAQGNSNLGGSAAPQSQS